MGNFDTAQAITKNLETVLKGLGINFTTKCYDDPKSIPESLLPLGEIFYNREVFENTHGERPSYAEAEYNLRVTLNHRDAASMVRSQQKWLHLIRDGVTINALNIDALASSKLVSRVTTEEAAASNDSSGGISALNYLIRIRYREA